MLEKLDHGHNVLRIYGKSLLARLYEKFATFLRLEICVNRLKDLGLKKGLENLNALRQTLVTVTDRLAGFEADLLNVHVDFPLFQRLAKPIPSGQTKIPGIKIQDTRMLRLIEVLLHGGSQLAGWRTAQIHESIRAVREPLLVSHPGPDTVRPPRPPKIGPKHSPCGKNSISSPSPCQNLSGPRPPSGPDSKLFASCLDRHFRERHLRNPVGRL